MLWTRRAASAASPEPGAADAEARTLVALADLSQKRSLKSKTRLPRSSKAATVDGL
jgi:hypothetical protein